MQHSDYMSGTEGILSSAVTSIEVFVLSRDGSAPRIRREWSNTSAHTCYRGRQQTSIPWCSPSHPCAHGSSHASGPPDLVRSHVPYGLRSSTPGLGQNLNMTFAEMFPVDGQRKKVGTSAFMGVDDVIRVCEYEPVVNASSTSKHIWLRTASTCSTALHHELGAIEDTDAC